MYILQHGPSPAYGTHKILKRSQSTVQTSMKGLKDAGLVSLYSEVKGKKGGTKLMYGLTLEGFCYGFSSIVKRETTTYELIEHLIDRWQHLCPDVLGSWDLLIDERQDGCSFSANLDEENYSWQGMQLPYQVPSLKVKHWILFIAEICEIVICEINYYYGRGTSPTQTPEDIFIARLSSRTCDHIMLKPGGRADLCWPWDPDYLLCIFRRIPGLWNRIRHDLNRWRDMYEKNRLQIQQILDKYD